MAVDASQFAPPQIPAAPEIDVPQTAPPEQFDFSIPLSKEDRDAFAVKHYGPEIDRALQARRSGASTGYQWLGDIPDAATKATRVVDTRVSPIKSWEDMIQDLWARYEMIPPDRELPFDGAANYRIPLTRWMIDAVLSRILAGLATIRPIFRVEARRGEDTDTVGKVEEFLDYVMEQEVSFVPWLDDALQQAAVEGAGIAYVTWQVKKEHRLVEEVAPISEPVVDPTTGLPVQDIYGQSVMKKSQISRIVERADIVEERPNVDLIPMTDFLVGDPRRKRLADQPWMGHRTRMYRAELEQLRGQPGYFDEEINDLLQGAGNVVTSPSTLKAEQGVDTRVGVATGSTAYPTMRMMDTFDIWTLLAWYDWDQDGQPERVVAEIAMPQKRLIRLIKFPYLHNHPFYVPLVLLPRAQSWYPRSLAMDLKMTQDEMDAMHNHRTDATSIAIASLFMFLYDDQAGYDPSRTRIALGESIRVTGDMNHIQSLARAYRSANVPGADIEAQLLDFAKFLTGVHEVQTGGMVSKRATAFEVGQTIQEGNVKFRRMIERVSESLAEVAYQVIALYQQHGNRVEPKVFKVLNDQENPFREIDMGELAGRYNYRVHGIAIAGQRDMDAKKAMDMLQLSESSRTFMELIGMDPRRRYHLAKTVLDKIGWPVEELIGKEEDLIAYMQAQAVAAQQQQAAQGTAVNPEVERFVTETQRRIRGGGEGELGQQAVQEGTGV